MTNLIIKSQLFPGLQNLLTPYRVVRTSILKENNNNQNISTDAKHLK